MSPRGRAIGRRLALGTSLLTCAAPVAARAQLAVDAAELVFEPARGDSILSFRVSNAGEEPAEAIVYLGDWERRENGENVFTEPGTLAVSCGAHLEVFPTSLRIPPAGAQSVRIGLRGADSLSSACWSIVFVEGRPKPMSRGTGISYAVRLGIKTYVLPPGLVAEGMVEETVVRGTPAGERSIAFRFRNTAGLPLNARPSVEIRRLDNTMAANLSMPEIPVLPGAVRAVDVTVPALPPGRYVALVLVDYAGAEIAASQAELVIE